MAEDDTKPVSYWMDRPITDLSKDELIEVVGWMGRELHDYRDRYHRLLSYGVTGGSIPHRDFLRRLQDWLDIRPDKAA